MAWTQISWLEPTGVRCTISPRIQRGASWRYGSPDGSSDQPPQPNLSIPLVANRAERSAWSPARKLTTSVSAFCNAGHELEVPATEKASRGGSADTEITEVAVNPTSRSTARKVITATPAACRRNNALNASAEIASGWAGPAQPY